MKKGIIISGLSAVVPLVLSAQTGQPNIILFLVDDIGENQDLSAKEPKLVEKLSKELGKYLRKVGGQRPIFKETGMPVPWPDEVQVNNNLTN